MRRDDVALRAVRRPVLFGAPLLAYVAGMLHPKHVLVDGSAWRYIGVHLAWPALACLLAWMFLLLVEGVDGFAATATRVLAIPFAVAYTSFTAFAGVGIGAFVWKANELPAPSQPPAGALIDSVTHSQLMGPLRWTANGLWLATALAAVVALRRRAPGPALALFALGAAAFGLRHEPPWGPGGMAAILAAVLWFELKPKPAGAAPLADRTLRFGR